MNNQDYALARWREDRAKGDPEPYTVEERHGARYVWMSVNGNVGWWWPEMVEGKLVGIRWEALPRRSAVWPENPDQYRKLNHAFNWVSGKQARKIEEVMA